MNPPVRASGSVRLLVVGLAWIGATLFGLAVAATTTIGPVVLNVTRSHGVHMGDLVAFSVAYVVALLVTLVAFSV